MHRHAPHPILSRLLTDAIEAKLRKSNIFTVAKRNIDGHDMLYQSVKLTNGIWCLIELTLKPASSAIQVTRVLLCAKLYFLVKLRQKPALLNEDYSQVYNLVNQFL